ncbi:MAG: preprotein translocase subunit SecG [Chloroflexaceae bacterium]|nr:preprotein translocase subunit SecG [Chloroflexaceae bacterium]
METALFIAIILVATLIILLVIVQARSPGLAGSDASSAYHTKRGLEKTLHQTTIVMSAIFLLLSLIASLPIYS